MQLTAIIRHSVLLSALAAPVWAHHSFTSEFDLYKPLQIEGKITEVEWANPHVILTVAVPDNKGGNTIWRSQLMSISHMTRYGLRRDSLSVGSEVTVKGFVAKSKARLLGTSSLTIAATGKTITIYLNSGSDPSDPN